MKVVEDPEGVVTLVVKGGLTPGMFAFLGHIRGLLEVEFGRKQVTYEVETGERTETAILHYDYYDPLVNLLKGLIDEVNRDSGVRYAIKDIDHVSFELISDNEGGKIKLVAHSSQFVEGCESDKHPFHACEDCDLNDDEAGCLDYLEKHHGMKVGKSGKELFSTSFSAVGVKVNVAGRAFR